MNISTVRVLTLTQKLQLLADAVRNSEWEYYENMCLDILTDASYDETPKETMNREFMLYKENPSAFQHQVLSGAMALFQYASKNL